MALALNTPLAEALNNRIQPKLVEIGWSVGDDNSPLGEYICLMIVNGKSQEQIASELSGDLLGLGPDDASAAQFARWLFDELESLKRSMGGESDSRLDATNDDEEMVEAEDGQEGVPTAPKAMRHPNPRRLINQLTKAMERKPQDALHRVRQQPSERIDKFKREPPKGPARQNGPRHNMMNNNRHHQNRMINRPFGPGQSMLPHNISPQQQMALYQMYQQQSQMIAPYSNGPPPGAGFPGVMGGPHGPRNMLPTGMPMEDAYSNNLSQPQRTGGSLFERIQAPPDLSRDEGMDTGDEKADGGSWNSSSNSEKLEEVPCKFGIGCTKGECPFAHPTPATPAGKPAQYVSGERCPFGVKCKNKKCTGSHPSPASTPGFHVRPKQVEQDCKFFPNCTNPACPFKHPTMPMCRNGANCTRPDCHFTHAETACRFKPCLNPNCIYKHEEGQQQVAPPSDNPFGNKVWTAPGKGRVEHVSERKFVSGDGTEELIIPGQTDKEGDMDTAPLDVE